jgi:hypothetical protein
LDVKGAAIYTNFPESCLNKLRCFGGGPKFIKKGRAVRYDPDDLDTWLESLKKQSTSEVSAA